MSVTHALSRLLPFPGTRLPGELMLEAACQMREDGALGFSYRLRGDIAKLSLQLGLRQEPVELPQDRLWQYSCFEAFVAISGEAAYREFNFVPNGQWATFVFDGYRQPSKASHGSAAGELARFSCVVDAGWLNLSVTVPRALWELDNAVAGSLNAGLDIGLSAVIQARSGEHSYWALQHAADKPDFHRRESFILHLPASDAQGVRQTNPQN